MQDCKPLHLIVKAGVQKPSKFHPIKVLIYIIVSSGWSSVREIGIASW